MGILVDGKAIAEKIDTQSAAQTAALKAEGVTPRLEVLLVGDDPASQMYVRMKGAAAEKIGVAFALHELPPHTAPAALIETIYTIQKNPELSGLILQLPLPEHLFVPEVLNAIDPRIDVDFLTNENCGALLMDRHPLLPPTPGAVMSILETIGADVAGKSVTIVGVGNLVGKPLAMIMMNAGASVTTVNSRTKNAKEKCLSADIIVTGVGKSNLIRGDMVRDGAIVIDTGISFDDEGKVSGDVHIAEVIEKASYVTPTPGGVGPVTVARLLGNTVQCAERLARARRS